MRVICTGSRTWKDREVIASKLKELPPNCVIVVGYNPKKKSPKGADELVWQEAKSLGLAVETHPALWDEAGKVAGFQRNQRMANSGADLCLAFWDGESRGTQDMIWRACNSRIPTEVIRDASL
jgi:hypothetical protein